MATGKDLRKALKANDLTMENAAKQLNVSRGTMYNYVDKEELDDEFVQIVQEKLGIDLNAGAVPFIKQRFDQKNNDEPYLVPFVDIPAQAGYSKAYQQRDYIASLKKYPILPDVDPTGAIWRYFQIEGDSMEPEIMGGDTILASQVHKEDWQNIKDYHTHVIVTDDNLWIKDVFKKSIHSWLLLSQNEIYKAIPIEVTQIRQVWVMRRHIKARAKKHRHYNIDDELKRLE